MSYPTTLDQLRLAANRAQGYAAEVAGAAAEAIETLDGQKSDKTNAVSFTLPTSGWGSDTSVSAYPKYYDVAVTGLTANDTASVTLAPNSIQAAVSCGICPTCETLAGKIRIRAASVPTAAITAQYWIEKGKV